MPLGVIYYNNGSQQLIDNGTTDQILISTGTGNPPTFQTLPIVGNAIISTANPAAAIASLAGTCWLGINATALTLTKAAAQTPIPYDATVSSLYVYVTANLSTDPVTVEINVNGTNTGIIATIPALTTGTFTDLANSAAISAGDEVQFEVSTGVTGIVTGVIVANLRG